MESEREREEERNSERERYIYIHTHHIYIYILYIYTSINTVSYIHMGLGLYSADVSLIQFWELHIKGDKSTPSLRLGLRWQLLRSLGSSNWKFSKPKLNKPWRIDDQSTISTIWCVWIVPRGLGDTEVISVHSSFLAPPQSAGTSAWFHQRYYITYIRILTLKLTNLDRTVWTHAHSPHRWK